MSRYEADVIVIGAGPSGVCCAVAARRRGARVLLLEASPMAGGVPAICRVYSTLTFHGGDGSLIVGGIPQEIIDRMIVAGGSPGHVLDTVGVAHSVTPVDPDLLPLVLQDMLSDEDVHLMLESQYQGCRVENGCITGINGFHPGGTFEAAAKVYVDCTGSGQLCADSGVPWEAGRDGGLMPATLIFEVDRVKIDRAIDYALANREQFHHETLFDHLKQSPAPGLSGFFDLWREADLPVPRDRLLFYASVIPGRVGINSTRINGFDPKNPESVTGAYQQGRRQVTAITRFLQEKVPGFEDCRLAAVAPFIGVREVRRVRGEYFLCAGDLARGAQFEDQIALGGFPVDVHSPGGKGIESAPLGGRGYYGIPYRCLVPLKTDNLLMAGKCFSADFTAHASARVQATSMAMGQAAGAAAALCAKTGTAPRHLNSREVRQGVNDLGGILEPQGGGLLR